MPYGACGCPESKEPISVSGNRPGRLWRVLQRNENYSAFNGYRRKWSEWSTVTCLSCHGQWRTKAKFVGELKDASEEDRNRAGPNTTRIGERDTRGEHRQFMIDMGRDPIPNSNEKSDDAR